jgi:hypothetical protein
VFELFLQQIRRFGVVRLHQLVALFSPRIILHVKHVVALRFDIKIDVCHDVTANVLLTDIGHVLCALTVRALRCVLAQIRVLSSLFEQVFALLGGQFALLFVLLFQLFNHLRVVRVLFSLGTVIAARLLRRQTLVIDFRSG